MSRLDILTVVIVAICLAALGYLLFKTFNMIGGDSETTPDRTEYTDTSTDGLGADDTYDPYDPGSTPPGDSPAAPADGVPTVEGQEGYAGSSETDSDFGSDATDTPASTTSPATTPTQTSSEPATTTAPTTGYSEGKYLVIAGTFRQMSNAERQVSRLIGMGYGDTRVSKFDRGKYAVALVNRFSSLSSARQLERELESKGIDAEVITE